LGEDYESQAHPTESYPEASRGEGGQEEGSGGGSTLERPASPEVEYDGEEWWVVGGGQAEPEVQVWWQGAEPEPQVAAGEQEVQEQEHEGGWHHVADAEEEEPIDEFDFDELIELLHGPSPSGSPYPYDWEEGSLVTTQTSQPASNGKSKQMASPRSLPSSRPASSGAGASNSKPNELDPDDQEVVEFDRLAAGIMIDDWVSNIGAATWGGHVWQLPDPATLSGQHRELHDARNRYTALAVVEESEEAIGTFGVCTPVPPSRELSNQPATQVDEVVTPQEAVAEEKSEAEIAISRYLAKVFERQQPVEGYQRGVGVAGDIDVLNEMVGAFGMRNLSKDVRAAVRRAANHKYQKPALEPIVAVMSRIHKATRYNTWFANAVARWMEKVSALGNRRFFFAICRATDRSRLSGLHARAVLWWRVNTKKALARYGNGVFAEPEADTGVRGFWRAFGEFCEGEAGFHRRRNIANVRHLQRIMAAGGDCKGDASDDGEASEDEDLTCHDKYMLTTCIPCSSSGARARKKLQRDRSVRKSKYGRYAIETRNAVVLELGSARMVRETESQYHAVRDKCKRYVHANLGYVAGDACPIVDAATEMCFIPTEWEVASSGFVPKAHRKEYNARHGRVSTDQ